MKKIFAGLLVFVLIFSMFSFPSNAKAAVTDWDVTGTYVWNVFGVYFHDINITTQNPNGSFSGTGSWPAGVPEQTGEIITGQVTEDTFTFQTVYTGPYGAGSVFNMTGTIAPNGKISGTVPWVWSFDNALAEDTDTDNDGILNGSDYCDTNTTPDSDWDVSWGTNRFKVRDSGSGILKWYQNQPVKKGKGTTPVKMYGIDYTYGCNGHQILEMLQDEMGAVMNGHWKYGLSSSVVEEFHMDMNDGILDGKYFVETIQVNANNVNNTMSMYPLVDGTNYIIKSSGMANAGDSIDFDAKCSFRTGSSTQWTDAVSTYEGYGTQLLDLYLNGMNVDWGPCNASHMYEYMMVGDGSNASFNIYDVYYPNNTGFLTVNIYAQL